MRFSLNFFIVLIGAFSISCSNSRESEKKELIKVGLEQSAEFSENFLNFYYENQIERNEAEYPEYFKETASKMRKIWYFCQDFDSFYSDTSTINISAQAKMYTLYIKSLDSLNLLAQTVDTLFLAIDFEDDISNRIVYKNHLEITKNILLRKFINSIPKQIQSKKYYAFQVLKTEISSSDSVDEIFLSLEDMYPNYKHSVLIDSIFPKANYKIDSSLILGKIKLESEVKGIHTVYGRIKLVGQNGTSFIPFFQSFELY